TKLNSYKQIDIDNEISNVFSAMVTGIRKIIELWPEIVNITDFKLQTPLMLAANNRDHQTVEALLKANADPNLQDFTGRTALHAAAASRCLKSAYLILEHGCDATLINEEGATVLHTATRMGDLPIIELLIEKRPELLKIEDSKGIIPEQLAREIANNPLAYDVLKNFLLSEGRSIARHETYKKILEVF
ncbi:TPA: ankyrin repeat domain-containing protein, partial [Vibrio parahaemolyticus]|nr:ankyrin repeat domain-containing protein [Vibrio parahaemolyticus]